MPVFRLNFQIDGQTQIDRAIDGVREIPEDMSPAWREIKDDFYEGERQQFTQEGSFEGNSHWVALTPRYQAWKSRVAPGMPILSLRSASPNLRESLQEGGAFNITVIDKQSFTVGSTLKVRSGNWNLAMLHQKGTPKMPARPPIRLSRAQKTRWVSIVRRFLVGQMERL